MRTISAGFVLLTSFCVVSICAAHLTLSFFTDGAGTTPSGSASSSRAAAAAAGISSSTSSSVSSISSSVLSVSYATLSTISASIVALLYSTRLFSPQLDGILIKFPGPSTTQSHSCCSATGKHMTSLLSCTCPDSVDDDSVVAVVDVSRDSTNGKSKCSIGDDFMSCRMPPKTMVRSKHEPVTPEQELLKALAEGEYANNLCALEGTVDCSVNSACFQLGLCTNPTIRPAPKIPHPGLQLYKPSIVSLPTPPQSSHLLSSLLGPSSKTTLLLRAFAKSIYKFNNISVMSSISTDTGDQRNSERPTPISTFTVVPPPTGTADGGLLQEEDKVKDVEKRETHNAEKAEFVTSLAISIPEEFESQSPVHLAEESRLDLQHQPEQRIPPSNKSTGIATRLNVREVLEASRDGSYSRLGLVIAMVCFVGMGM
ncbi:hypothetical protein V1525DRAFT_425768 [Lipomyces kononenkoae]|uniref:Uncharacterized protein n=1 Tax=Lipomyces kononenkoae TaxID=34357 RepID=A0ACC3T4M9_LIPKO